MNSSYREMIPKHADIELTFLQNIDSACIIFTFNVFSGGIYAVMKRSVLILFIITLFFFSNVAEADVDDPSVFHRGSQPHLASFHIAPSTSTKNAIELEITPNASVNYEYSFLLLNAKSDDIFEDTSEVIKSSEGHYNYSKDKDHKGIKDTIVFRIPQKSEYLYYWLYAKVERSPSLISEYIDSFEARVEVCNVDGVTYVFVSEIWWVEE